ITGVIIGPYGFGWVVTDEPVQIFALIGLSFLLYLAGLEVNLTQLRGPMARVAALGFGVSCALALLVGLALGGLGLILRPLFIGIILVASSAGIILPAVKASGYAKETFGQLVIVSASLAEFGAIILMSVFFTNITPTSPQRIVLLVMLALLSVSVLALVLRAERSKRLTALLLRLQDSTAQVRVRGVWVILAAFVVLAVQGFGIAAILGAFIAGVITRIIDPDAETGHPQLRLKLDAIGYGVFIPVFFIMTGLQFDVRALFSEPRALTLVPVMLVALLLVRGTPALLYRHMIGGRKVVAAGFLQATTLTFVLAAQQIGLALHVILPATSAALVATALLSVLFFPLIALALLSEAPSSVSMPTLRPQPSSAEPRPSE
ncbi:MAG TPA: cation:proton antiporter, partial [Ktedonobacterales bacterium]